MHPDLQGRVYIVFVPSDPSTQRLKDKPTSVPQWIFVINQTNIRSEFAASVSEMFQALQTVQMLHGTTSTSTTTHQDHFCRCRGELRDQFQEDPSRSVQHQHLRSFVSFLIRLRYQLPTHRSRICSASSSSMC